MLLGICLLFSGVMGKAHSCASVSSYLQDLRKSPTASESLSGKDQEGLGQGAEGVRFEAGRWQAGRVGGLAGRGRASVTAVQNGVP